MTVVVGPRQLALCLDSAAAVGQFEINFDDFAAFQRVGCANANAALTEVSQLDVQRFFGS